MLLHKNKHPMEKITLLHFASYMEYHSLIFNQFIDHKDYDKLNEFIIMCNFIEYFRKILKLPKETMIIEKYVIEIKKPIQDSNGRIKIENAISHFCFSNDYSIEMGKQIYLSKGDQNCTVGIIIGYKKYRITVS